MPRGHCLVRLDAKDSWLESTPILIHTELAPLREISDTELAALAEKAL